MAKILLNYPSRSRPDKFIRTLREFSSLSSGKHELFYLIKIDLDDRSLNNQYMFNYCKGLRLKHKIEILSDCKGKIDAINRFVSNYEFDVVMSIADDMRAIQKNWDDTVINDFNNNYDLCLNYNVDKRINDFKTIIILPIIGNILYKKYNYIYHPSYKSEYCDNEQTIVFQKENKIKHIDNKLFRHDWSDNYDDLMKKNMLIGKNYDYSNFIKRQSEGFVLC